MRPRLTQLLGLFMAVALLAALAACNKQPPSKPAPGTKGAAAQLKPITPDPAPECPIAGEPASRPRGTVIAFYHTANVVGEVEPCG